MTEVLLSGGEDSGRKLVRAAQYVRMSTEHQKYSAANQAEIIALYAAARGFEVVRTYADEGKSGLNLSGREALQELIADVTTGRADFSVILAYDVSRWGRFQDADMGAHYEFLCRNAGVAVHYCAEQFENDGSIGSRLRRRLSGRGCRGLGVGRCPMLGLARAPSTDSRPQERNQWRVYLRTRFAAAE
jgi:hypothetical protein